MRTIDALNILSITTETVTREVVKKAYHKACKAFHPDLNQAGASMMVAVNEAYSALVKETFPIAYNADEISNYGEELNTALNAIINCQGINIEVCGSWVWVSGNTKPFKTILKDSGYFWSKHKNMWYFRPEMAKKRYFKGNSSIDEIRTKYGSSKYFTHLIKALE